MSYRGCSDDGIDINRLPSQSTLGATDLLVIWSAQNQDPRYVTGQVMLNYVTDNIVVPTAPMTQYAAPTVGQTVTIAPTTDGQSVRALITPAGTLATLTVALPGVGGSALPVDRQEVTVISTQIITTLTVSAGSTTVTGAPATLAANDHFKMFYDAQNASWYPF